MLEISVLAYCASLASASGHLHAGAVDNGTVDYRGVDYAGVDYDRQAVSLAIDSEPPSLNSLKSSDQLSAFILLHTNEGLIQYGPNGELVAAVAERWQIDGLAARFWLRKDARWSDGRPVTAHDFVFAWRQVVNPATASGYASIMYPLKNAEKINRGELALDALGVRAVNDFELEVSFERPCPYFLSLTAFVSYYPVREDFYRLKSDRYAVDKEDLLFNGPYTLTHWSHGASMRLQKNPTYWRREAITIELIRIDHITSDRGAKLNLFKNSAIALTDLDADTLQAALKAQINIRQFDSGYLHFLRFNFRNDRESANLSLRRAMQAVFDPATVVNKIIGLPGVRPAYSLYPWAVKGNVGALRAQYPVRRVLPNLPRARTYLADYLRATQRQTPPTLTLLCGDSALASRQAEYLQNLFKLALDIDIIIDRQISKQRLAKERQGDFDLSLSNWGPDFDDAMTYADLYASWNPNNRGKYASVEYDRWLEVAQSTHDTERRVEALAELQNLVVRDVVILPIYESVLVYVQHPQLRGVVRSAFGGDPNLRYATISHPDTVAYGEKDGGPK